MNKKIPLDRTRTNKGDLTYGGEALLIELYKGGEAGILSCQ